MSNIQPFQSEKFGELVNLPRILDQNKTSTLNAANAANPLIAKAKAVDITKVPVQEYEEIDISLNDLYVKLDTTIKAQKGRREPFTQFFDEVRSLFTGEEKAVDLLKSEVKLLRDNWQKEKLRREKERQDAIQKELDKKNEAIELKQKAVTEILNRINTKAQVQMKVLSETFYSKKLEEMDGLKEKMDGYTASFDLSKEVFYLSVVNPNYPYHHTEEESGNILKETVAEYTAKLPELYINPLLKERDRLIELIPSRKMELERIANDAAAAEEANKRIQEEQAETQRKLEAQAEAQAAQANTQAEADKMTTLFDTHATAAPAISLAKGTSIKKAYKATTHAAHMALLFWWAKNELPKMSIEDLNLKISFTRTAANKALAEGELIEAEGLIIEDDVSTRGRKAKV